MSSLASSLVSIFSPGGFGLSKGEEKREERERARKSRAVPAPGSNIATWKWRGQRKQLGEFSHTCKVIFKGVPAATPDALGETQILIFFGKKKKDVNSSVKIPLKLR